jgi:hypothetical protein
MASKIELERNIRLLRNQMAELEIRCQQRGDKLMMVFEAIEPFFGIMTEAQQKNMLDEIDNCMDKDEDEEDRKCHYCGQDSCDCDML